jgi:hypothetical protein
MDNTTTTKDLHNTLEESTHHHCWTLSSSVETIWIGDDVSEFTLQLLLPDKIGYVICADLYLKWNRPLDQHDDGLLPLPPIKENNKLSPLRLKIAPNHHQEEMASLSSLSPGEENEIKIPILDFDLSKKTIHEEDLERQSFLLASILNACEKVLVMKVKVHNMKSFPEDVESFVCSLEFTTKCNALSLECKDLSKVCNCDDEDDTKEDDGNDSSGLHTFKVQSRVIQ